MLRAHLTLLSTLFVAALALPASAQTPTDSVVADSAAPKKTGRFGGLVNKAKKVAGNKAVQDAAKGAAAGVACTVVPGAAVVSAVTGSGPCANGLMGGMMSGGVAGTAATIASGAAAGAASKAMGKLGGTSGAAAAGALGALGGASGMKNAAAAAAAGAMMPNGAVGVMGNAAAMAAAQAAAARSMPNAADMSAMAAMAAGMMGTAGAAPAKGSKAKSPPANAAAAATPAASLWVNYDFVPGERVIFYSDFTDDQVGNFPERLQFVEGNLEVAELGGRRVMRATSQSKLTIPLPEVLPQRFTIEIDVINRPSLDGAAFQLRGSVGRADDRTTSVISWGSDGVGLLGGGGGEVKLANNDANRLRYRGKPTQLRIFGDGKYVKVYLDERRLANVPNANFERSKSLHLIIDARSEENPAYVGRIRVAEIRKSIYDDLAATGRVATQGLLFDTGSDQLRPESTPTLKQIATMLEQHPELRIRIEGHTDNIGAKDANRTLSTKRAAAVKAALVSNYKIGAGRLDSQGLGDTKPSGPNNTPEGRQNNRRVELVKL